EKNIKVDVVIPVPDTSRVSALELAQRLGLPYREGFVKNRYVGRTFIMPGQQMRKKNVRRKLNAMALEFSEKVVLLVDDSIVRGTTSKEIIQMAKDVGAKKVIFASCAPPIRYSNVYGIDMPSRNELVAYERSEDEIAKALGADVVIYQTLPDLINSVTQLNSELTRFDCSVFDGVYVTGDVQEDYLAHLEQLRSDNAKIKTMSMGMSLPPEQIASLSKDHARGRIANGINGGPYELHEEPLGCSGPMNGADDTVGLFNSWSVAASEKSREGSRARSDIGGLGGFTAAQ
ncbi:amidophosphoribosyltransferase, partial [Tulasnella sp. 427]